MAITYLSLFSGIEAATVAWKPLGWKCIGVCENDVFPAAVLAHRLPGVPNLGDIRNVDWGKFVEENGHPNVIVGGSPCFPAYVKVITSEGEKLIADVEVGDRVLTHRGRFKRVLKIGNHVGSTIRVFSNRRIIECTPNHPIWTGVDGWVPASDMVGRLWHRVLDDMWEPVVKVEECRHDVTVYNLEVEDDHSYTADGIAVSNCQSFSIAGGRDSLDGASRLMFEYLRAVREVRSSWVVFENVPGVLNVRDDAFGQLVEELQDIGYESLAWRVLDAQLTRVPIRDGEGRIARWVGPVPQRRRRVFLVGRLGAGGGASAVLIEPEGLRGDFASSKQKREELAAAARDGAPESGAGGVAFAQNQRDEVRYVGGDGNVSGCVAATRRSDCKNETLICQDASYCFKWYMGAKARSVGMCDDGTSPTLSVSDGHVPAVAINTDVTCMASGQANAEIDRGGVAPTLTLLHEAPIVCHEQATTRTCFQPCAQRTGTSGSSTINQLMVEDSSSTGGGLDEPICVADDNANAAIDVNLAGTLKIGGGGTFVAMRQTDRT